MSDINWDAAGWIAIGQLLVIVIFGFFYCTFIWLRYRNSPSLQFFRQGEYISGIFDDPTVVFQTPPKWFRFVIVQYEADNQVVSESFYTMLGDVTTIKFLEGRCLGAESNPYSNYVLIAAAAIGMGLVGFSNLLASPGLSPLVGDQSVVAQQLAKFGIVMFCSVFLSAPIKTIFDFANHLKFSRQQSNSN